MEKLESSSTLQLTALPAGLNSQSLAGEILISEQSIIPPYVIAKAVQEFLSNGISYLALELKESEVSVRHVTVDEILKETGQSQQSPSSGPIES